MYLEIYDLDMNLEYYAPTSVCEDCEISLSMYVLGKWVIYAQDDALFLSWFHFIVTGEIDFLKIKSPARWGECRGEFNHISNLCSFNLLIYSWL